MSKRYPKKQLQSGHEEEQVDYWWENGGDELEVPTTRPAAGPVATAVRPERGTGAPGDFSSALWEDELNRLQIEGWRTDVDEFERVRSRGRGNAPNSVASAREFYGRGGRGVGSWQSGRGAPSAPLSAPSGGGGRGGSGAGGWDGLGVWTNSGRAPTVPEKVAGDAEYMDDMEYMKYLDNMTDEGDLMIPALGSAAKAVEPDEIPNGDGGGGGRIDVIESETMRHYREMNEQLFELHKERMERRHKR